MTLGTIHGNGPDGVLSKVLGHIKDELGLPTDDGEGIEDLLEAFIELTSTTAPITETTWPSRPSTVGVPENWRSTKNRFRICSMCNVNTYNSSMSYKNTTNILDI